MGEAGGQGAGLLRSRRSAGLEGARGQSSGLRVGRASGSDVAHRPRGLPWAGELSLGSGVREGLWEAGKKGQRRRRGGGRKWKIKQEWNGAPEAATQRGRQVWVPTLRRQGEPCCLLPLPSIILLVWVRVCMAAAGAAVPGLGRGLLVGQRRTSQKRKTRDVVLVDSLAGCEGVGKSL